MKQANEKKHGYMEFVKSYDNMNMKGKLIWNTVVIAGIGYTALTAYNFGKADGAAGAK